MAECPLIVTGCVALTCQAAIPLVWGAPRPAERAGPSQTGLRPYSRLGSQSTIPGKAISTATVTTSATKKGEAPRNTS